MAQTIKLKRSAVQGVVPTTSQLELGEVAINTYDGKMYIKKNVGGTETIVEVGSTATFLPAGSDGQLQFNNGGDLGGTAQVYYDDVNNRLGIGTSTPLSTLHVDGTTTLSSSLDFLSPDTANTISVSMLDTDTLSFSGDSGQLFSITDSLSGTIFAVNDISGVPSIEVDDDGTIRFAETFGNVLIGTAVDDGEHKLQVNGDISADSIQLNTTAGVDPVATGQIAWNSDFQTANIGLENGVVLQVGQETHVYAKAAEAISNGSVVYASGAVGASGNIEVSNFIANGTIEERRVVGIATQDIAIGEFGYITTFGKVQGISTDGSALTTPEDWNLGDILYASPTVAGELTKVLPEAPNQAIAIAFVVAEHASNGTLMARAYDLGYHIEELHDVHTSSVAGNDILAWSAANSRWENTDIPTLVDSRYVNVTGDTMTGNLSISSGDDADQLRIVRTSPSSNQVGMSFAVEGQFERWFGVSGSGEPYWATSANLAAGNKIWHEGNFTPSDYLLVSNYVDDYVSSAAFNTSNGVLTLTRNQGGTVTVDLDGRYYNTADSDSRYVNVTGDTMTGALYTNTHIRSAGQIRATGWWSDAASTDYNGLGTEIGVSSGASYVVSYNRDTSSYGELRLSGSTVRSQNNFYAPIMYDSNDTAYYVNPNGNSNLLTLNLGQYADTTQGVLYLNGSTANKRSVLKTTNGNLHLDSDVGNGIYLNYYTGTTGVAFGNGAGAVVAWMGPDGDLWKGSQDNNGDQYLTQSSGDSRYVNVTGDTMTGTLAINNINASLQVGSVSSDIFTEIKHTNTNGYGFSFQHANASLFINQQGGTNQVLVLGDVDAGNTGTLFGIGHSADGGVNWTPKLNFRGDAELFIGASATSRVFHDGYHPNADKWTTARTNTVTLTGDVTGTGSASVDGSGNWTISVPAVVANDSHSHSNYVQKSGDTMTGELILPNLTQTLSTQGWQPEGSSITYEHELGGVINLYRAGAGYSLYSVQNEIYENFHLSVDFKTSTSTHWGVFFSGQTLDPENNSAQIIVRDANTVRVQERSNSVQSYILGTSSGEPLGFAAANGEWHRLEAFFEDGNLKVYVNGSKYIEGDISTSLDWLSGTVGLAIYDGAVSFKNFKISHLDILEDNIVFKNGRQVLSSSYWSNTDGSGLVLDNSNTIGAGITLRPTSSTSYSAGWSLYTGAASAGIGDGSIGFWNHTDNAYEFRVKQNGYLDIRSGYQINNTTVIDSSRNLTNITSISSGNITTSGYLRGPANFVIDPAAHGDNTGTVVIAGNLQVDGTTTTINSTTVQVDDKNIELAVGSTNKAAADGAGITIDCGTDTDATLLYDGVNDWWEFNKPLESTRFLQTGSVASNFYAIQLSRSGTGTTTPDLWGTNNTLVIGNSSSNPVISIDSSSRVGIGTSSPTRALEVAASGNDGIKISSGNALIGATSGSDAQLLYWNGTNSYYGRSSLGGSVAAHYFRSAGVDKFIVDSTGAEVLGILGVNSTFTLQGEEATLATTTQTQIASFSATTYGGGKFVITAKDGVNRHICELLVTHDGTTAVATQYGSVTTVSDLATYDVDISGGNVRILATSASTNSTVYKVAETLMEA